MTKLGAALASLAITTAGATLLATAPAQADTPTTVNLTFTDPSTGNQYTGWRALYGDRVGTLTTTISDGTASPTVGSATLQERLPGKTWTDQATDPDVSDGVTFTSPKALSNAVLRVQYSGGTDGGANTWEPSTSNQVQVLAYWKFTHGTAKWHGRLSYTWAGTLVPHVKGHRVLIQVKRGSWKKYKVVHTNSRSRWSVRVTAGRNHWVKYRAVVAATKTLHKNAVGAKFKVTFSRTATTTPRALIRR